MFGDLDWPLNASCRFVSISRACYWHNGDINKKLSWCWQTRRTSCYILYIYNRVGWCAAELLHIFYFQKGSRPPSSTFIFMQFCEKFKFSPISSSACKIWWKSDYPQLSYCIFSIFKIAAVRRLGFGMTS